MTKTKRTANCEQRTASKKGNLFLIGLGLNANSLTAEALEALKSSDKIYLENYTANFPYKISDLEKNYKIKIHQLSREQVESEQILKEAKTKNISLLVYGDPLSATTHTQFLISALTHQNTKTLKHCETRIFHNASILTAVSACGLSLYKFGKTTSMPNWKEHTNRPKSFADVIKQNQSIKAHTLILTDIGLGLQDAINQLKEAFDSTNSNTTKSTNSKESEARENLGFLGKIIILEQAGTKNQKVHLLPSPIHYLPSVSMPFCLIIPSDLNHIEEKALNILQDKS